MGILGLIGGIVLVGLLVWGGASAITSYTELREKARKYDEITLNNGKDV